MQQRLILGDQLNAGHSWYRERRDDVVYVMMEIRSETDYVRHHAQKVLAIIVLGLVSWQRFGAATEISSGSLIPRERRQLPHVLRPKCRLSRVFR